MCLIKEIHPEKEEDCHSSQSSREAGPSPCLALVQLICKRRLCTQDLPVIVLTLGHDAAWRATGRSTYYCLELKSRSQNCSGAKSNLFPSFHLYEVEMTPTSHPPCPRPSICKPQGRYVRLWGWFSAR